MNYSAEFDLMKISTDKCIALKTTDFAQLFMAIKIVSTFDNIWEYSIPHPVALFIIIYCSPQHAVIYVTNKTSKLAAAVELLYGLWHTFTFTL